MSTHGEHPLKRMGPNKREDSWAVWETDSSGEPTGVMMFPLAQAREAVHTRTILIALNPGGTAEAAEDREDWGNFHAPDKKHNDRFLAHAFAGTPFWGSYIADLLPDVFESDSGKVKTTREVQKEAVEILVEKASLLGASNVVCIGDKAARAVQNFASLLEEGTGITTDSVYFIWHYARTNVGKHKHDPEVYRAHVHERLGLA